MTAQFTRFSMIRRAALAAGALALLGFAAAPAEAGANLDAIEQAGVLKVGTEGTYAPFTYHDKDGKLVGFDVEIAEAIGKKLGVKVEFVEGKWDGLIAGLDANRYDAVINEVGITEERKKKFAFSEPYIASRAVLIVKDDNVDIKSFADLKGKKAAQSLTSNFAKIAQENGAEIVGTEGFDQSIALVTQGRADATINDSLSFFDFKNKQAAAPVKIVAQENDASYSGVLLRQGDPELVDAINKALKELDADGSYQQIAKKYFGQDVSK